MQDNDVAYGFNKAALSNAKAVHSLSKLATSYFESTKNLADLHAAQSRVSKCLEEWTNTTEALHECADGDLDELSNNVHPAAKVQTPMVDDKAARLEVIAQDRAPDMALDAVATRQVGIFHECNLPATFEVGSLEFFRSPEHVAFVKHLDRAVDILSDENHNDVTVHLLSASLSVPRESILMFRDTAAAA